MIGQSIVVSGVTATIVGIAPPGFIGAWSDARADLWLPLTMQHALGYRSNMSSYGDVESAAMGDAGSDRVAQRDRQDPCERVGAGARRARGRESRRHRGHGHAVDDPRFRCGDSRQRVRDAAVHAGLLTPARATVAGVRRADGDGGHRAPRGVRKRGESAAGAIGRARPRGGDSHRGRSQPSAPGAARPG